MLVMEFIGYVGNDAEIKEFNGQKFISFNVATSERYKDAQGNTVSRTTWVSCLKPGESAVVQYLKKGTQVFVRGDFSAKTFTGANGIQVGVNCRVRELQLLGTKQDAGQQATTQAGQPVAPASAQPQAPAYGSNNPFGETNDKDDLPF